MRCWPALLLILPLTTWSTPRYVALSTAGEGGNNLITEAGGGLVVVNMEYRLGVFGFLPGSQVKQNGALNAGLRESCS